MPWLGSPLREPSSEALYPPRVTETPTPAPPPSPPPAPPARPPAAPPPDRQTTPPADGVPDQPSNGGDDQDVTPAAAILAALTDAGATGATRSELDTAAGTAPAATRHHLDSLIRDGHVVRQGSGRATRYRLTWHAHAHPQPPNEPSSEPPAASGDTPTPPRRRHRTD
ncbi:MAG: hypothetical protein ACRDT6_16860 [Micromonosporaceae bacterium]